MYCSVSLCTGVLVRFGWSRVVSECRLNQLYVTLWKFFIAQHVSNVITFILRSLCTALFRCVLVYWCGSAGVGWYPNAGSSTTQIVRFLFGHLIKFQVLQILKILLVSALQRMRSLGIVPRFESVWAFFFLGFRFLSCFWCCIRTPSLRGVYNFRFSSNFLIAVCFLDYCITRICEQCLPEGQTGGLRNLIHWISRPYVMILSVQISDPNISIGELLSV